MPFHNCRSIVALKPEVPPEFRVTVLRQWYQYIRRIASILQLFKTALKTNAYTEFSCAHSTGPGLIRVHFNCTVLKKRSLAEV